MELLISHRRQWFQQKRLALFVAAAFISYRATAQETTGGQRWFDQDTMTGNWGGARSSLRDAGIDLRAHFTTESAGNPMCYALFILRRVARLQFAPVPDCMAG